MTLPVHPNKFSVVSLIRDFSSFLYSTSTSVTFFDGPLRITLNQSSGGIPIPIANMIMFEDSNECDDRWGIVTQRSSTTFTVLWRGKTYISQDSVPFYPRVGVGYRFSRRIGSNYGFSNWYAGGALIPAETRGFPEGVVTPIPSSGRISFSNFHQSGPYNISLVNTTNQMNLRNYAIQNGWDQKSLFRFTIPDSRSIDSENINTPALTIDGDWPAGLELVVEGGIGGKGGKGANGSRTAFFTLGESGGTAVYFAPNFTSPYMNITIRRRGWIGGGGGGGSSVGGAAWSNLHPGGVGAAGGGGGAGEGRGGDSIHENRNTIVVERFGNGNSNVDTSLDVNGILWTHYYQTGARGQREVFLSTDTSTLGLGGLADRLPQQGKFGRGGGGGVRIIRQIDSSGGDGGLYNNKGGTAGKGSASGGGGYGAMGGDIILDNDSRIMGSNGGIAIDKRNTNVPITINIIDTASNQLGAIFGPIL
jgi:hypothetical protein